MASTASVVKDPKRTWAKLIFRSAAEFQRPCKLSLVTDGLPRPKANSPSFASLLTCGESITELEKSGVREGRKH